MSGAAIAGVPEKRQSMGEKLQRIRALDRAGLLIGKAVLSELTGIPERTLRSYASVERGLPDHALIGAAKALEEQCAAISAHAAKLRELAGGQ